MRERDIAEFRERLFWELDRVIGSLDGVDDATANRPPAAPNANSLVANAMHAISAAEEHVRGRLCRLAVEERDDFRSRDTVSAVLDRYAQVRTRIESALASLRPEALDEMRDSPIGPVTGHHTLIHAICHAADHAGVAELTRDLVVVPSATPSAAERR